MEEIYREMARSLAKRHGRLVRVESLSHYPNFEINFVFERETVFSGHRRGPFDIHFLTLGYEGEGPRYSRAFLDELGFTLSSEDIASINPGDSVEKSDAQGVVIQRQSVALPEEVCWVCKKPKDGYWTVDRPPASGGRGELFHSSCYSEMHRKDTRPITPPEAQVAVRASEPPRMPSSAADARDAGSIEPLLPVSSVSRMVARIVQEAESRCVVCAQHMVSNDIGMKACSRSHARVALISGAYVTSSTELTKELRHRGGFKVEQHPDGQLWTIVRDPTVAAEKTTEPAPGRSLGKWWQFWRR